MEEKMLSEKHQAFCELYLQYFNATKAYMQVFKDASYGTARANSTELMKREDVQEFLSRRLDELAITSNEVVLGLAKIARNEEEKTTDRIRAYELLGKTKGIFLDRTDITTAGQKVSWQQFINSESGEVKKDIP